MTAADGTRRLIAAGTGTYLDAAPLPAVADDVVSVGDLFTRLGYDVDPVVLDPPADELRRTLAHAADVGSGVVVFYYSGHGDRERDRHYLLCADSRPGRLASSALATEDVIRILTGGSVRRLLVILDTCYAGDGAIDAVRAAAKLVSAELLATPGARPELLSTLSLIAAARPRQLALDGAFSAAMRAALDDHTLAGARQRFLDLAQLVGWLNDEFRRRGIRQHAVPIELWREDGFGFFPNPRYRPDLPAEGIDLAVQQTWETSRSEDLASHFVPRGRGSDGMDVPTAFYFSGRQEVLEVLARCVRGDGPDRALLVTGSPGVGKSSLLGRLVSIADADIRQTLPDEPSGIGAEIDAAVHARRRTLDDLVSRIAEAAGLVATSAEELLAGLAERQEPLRIVVDALDEAGTGADEREPLHIARVLLRRLAQIPCVRLIVGARWQVRAALGPQFTVIDLDERRWLSLEDLQYYVTALLLAPHGPGSSSEYDQATAPAVARVLARQTFPNFLNARLTARELAARAAVTDFADLDELPTAQGGVEPSRTFRWALSSRASGDNEWARTLLTPFAYAQGAGLPAARVWTVAAAALGGRPITASDLDWLLDRAGPYLVESLDRHGRSVYRLYHEAFAQDLRATAGPDDHGRMVAAWIASVPELVDGARDWERADPYLVTYLAEHARQAGALDGLVSDPEFLVNADRAVLLPAITDVRSEEAVRIRQVYERSAQHLEPDSWLPERRSALHLAAAQTGLTDVGAILEQLPLAWAVRWSVWDAITPHQRIGHHSSPVTALTWCVHAGRPVLIVGDASGALHAWDHATGDRLSGPVPLHSDRVLSVAVLTDSEAGQRVVSIGEDRSLQQWDPFGDTAPGPAIQVIDQGFAYDSDVVATMVGDEAVAVVANAQRVTVLSLTTGRQIRQYQLGRGTAPVKLALTRWRGAPAVLAGYETINLRLPDLRATYLISLLDGRVRRRRRLFGDLPVAGDHFGRPVLVRGTSLRQFLEAGPVTRRLGRWGRTVREISVGEFLSSSAAVTTYADRLVLVGRDLSDNIYLLDLESGDRKVLFRGGGQENGDFGLPPAPLAIDGRLLIAIAQGRTVTVVDDSAAAEEYPLSRRLRFVREYSSCLALSAYGDEIAVCADHDDGLVLRDLATGHPLEPDEDRELPLGLTIVRGKGHIDCRFLVEGVPGPDMFVTQVRRTVADVVPAGDRLIEVHRRPADPGARLTDLRDGRTWVVPFPWRYAWSWAAALVGDDVVLCASQGSLVGTSSDSKRYCWTREVDDLGVQTGLFVLRVRGRQAFVVTTEYGVIHALDAETGEPLIEPLPNGRVPVRAVDARVVGEYELLAVGSSDYTVTVWDLGSRARVAVVEVGSLIDALRLTPDGAVVVLARNGELCIDLAV
ncbi:caspase family protein [Micromonospora sp. BQ11]|uniref:caspase family protein n=1 Tax=Micromonospora sp. BQ11 TaxID=3452212 RepID=UPI003F887E6D